MIQKPLDYLIF